MKKVIGFIGTGVMGASMVSHLLDAGYTVNVYNRTKSKTDALLEKGAIWEDSSKEVAMDSDVIMTMLGYPTDVEDIYFNKSYGIIEYAKEGSILIDFTTSTPSLAKKIYEESKKKNLVTIDAPVSGGDVGAKNGTLTIMCGGDEKTFEECLPFMQTFGKSVILQGSAGAGQHTNMSNQIAIAAGIIGVCESIRYAENAGLDPERVLESISGGAAGSWSLSNYGPRILQGDFAPGFYVKHFIKDLRIAIDEAKNMGLETPGLVLVEKLYNELAEAGFENHGTHALYNWYFN
jgi:3-hydroxyisobutyrate dehydrogenase-like beta-hydroxyacid dehydrogenase